MYGSPGDYLASGIDGAQVVVHGNAQDQLAQIMKGGSLVVYGDVGQARRLPPDWGGGWHNVWLGVSTGCKQTLNKMESLRRIAVHPKAVRFLSAEPLLEDIAEDIDLSGFGWVIVGGESGSGPQYLWDPNADWRKEFDQRGRREMLLQWARRLRIVCKEAQVPFFFKQVTAFRPGQGEEALGRTYHEVPPPPFARWAVKPEQTQLRMARVS